MGLDMFAIRTAETFDSPTPTQELTGEVTHFHGWRKHPDLHGWMEQLYYEKGGQEESFNCTPVVLTSEDLDRLENAVKHGLLPPTQGFFFGQSDGSEKEDDLDFIAKARAAIAEGDTVLYDSWW